MAGQPFTAGRRRRTALGALLALVGRFAWRRGLPLASMLVLAAVGGWSVSFGQMPLDGPMLGPENRPMPAANPAMPMPGEVPFSAAPSLPGPAAFPPVLSPSAAAAPRAATPALPPEETVVEVRVEGNRTVTLDKILPKIRTRAGRPFSTEQIHEDVRELYRLGVFINVRTFNQRVPGGVAVVFQVAERPLLQEVIIVGNDTYLTSVLRKEAELKAGDAADPFAVENGRRKIEEYYQHNGYSKVRVSVLEGNKAGDLRAVFVVNEGPRQKVFWVNFVGNTFVSTERLKYIIKSGPPYFYLFAGDVDRKQVDEDVSRLTAYYRGFGFFHASVGRALEFNEKQNWLTITFVIDEGPRYAVRNVSFLGNRKFETSRLTEKLKLVSGMYFDQAQQNMDLQKLRDEYGGDGYVFSKVEADNQFLEEPGKLDIVYNVSEGSRYRVGRINIQIKGENPHTQIMVVLNRLSFKPGDIVDTREFAASERRLKMAQIFKSDPQKQIEPKVVYSPPNSEDNDTQVAGQKRSTYYCVPGGDAPLPPGECYMDIDVDAGRAMPEAGSPPQYAPYGGLHGTPAYPQPTIQPRTFQPQTYQPQTYQPQTYQPQTYQPQTYQPQTFQPQTFQPQTYQPQTFQPQTFQPQAATAPVFNGQAYSATAYPPQGVQGFVPYQTRYEPDDAGAQAQAQWQGQSWQPSVYGNGPSGGQPPQNSYVQQSPNYPVQQPQQSYPAPQAQQYYPAQQPQQNYPAQQPQQNYPAQQSPAAGQMYYNPPVAPFGASPAANPPGPVYGAAPNYGAPNGAGPAFGYPAGPAPVASYPTGGPSPYPLAGPAAGRPVENVAATGDPYGNPAPSMIPLTTGDPTIDLPVRLSPEETQTGRLMFGLGVNSDAGLVGNITLDEQNFDWRRLPTSWDDLIGGQAFRGAGEKFRLELVPGTQVQRYSVTFDEPYLANQPVDLGLNGFYYERIYPEWTEYRAGGGASIGYQFTHDLTGKFRFQGQNVNIENPQFPVPSLIDVLGHSQLYTFGVSLQHDTRDSPFLASEGHLISASVDETIGTFQYPKASVEWSQFFRIFERADRSGKHVLSFKVQAGYSGDETPIFERYYAGGFSTIRGFAFRGVTPRDPVYGMGVGGDFQMLATTQYLFPITADDMLRGVVFVDAGTVEPTISQWTDKVRVAPGFGLRISIPMMGPAPIALDFAFPISQQNGDQTQWFSFFVGFNH